MKYSVLTYIFNGYEFPRKIKNKQEDVEYILVTDDEGLKSNDWTIIVDKNLIGLSAFEKCYYVRFHPFEYVHSDIVVRVDGSVDLYGDKLSTLVEYFKTNNYDVSTMLHPDLYDILVEYDRWVRVREYGDEKRKHVINYLKEHFNYDFSNKFLIQENFIIEKKNEIVSEIDSLVYNTLLDIEKPIERIDQTVTSVILSQYIKEQKIKYLPLSNDLLEEGLIGNWHAHNSERLIKGNRTFTKRGFVNNTECELYPYMLNNDKSDIKLAILCHVYYPQIWNDNIKPRLKKFGHDFDLYISMPDSIENKEEITKNIKTEFPNVVIGFTPNLGSDVRGFFLSLKMLFETGKKYDYVLKIHTKSENEWCEELLNGLLPNNKNILLMAFESNNDFIGVRKRYNVYADKSFRLNCNFIEEEMSMCGCKTFTMNHFSGTMFWCKYDVLKKYFGNNQISPEYFDQEYAKGGTKMHSAEILFGCIAEDCGNNIGFMDDFKEKAPKCCFVRNYMWNELLNQTKFTCSDDVLYIQGANMLYGLKLLEKLFIQDRIQDKYEYVILVDEDCEILDMQSVYDMVDYMSNNDVDIMGMPDGGDAEIKMRTHRKDVPNIFFTILKTAKLKNEFSDYSSWETPEYEEDPKSTNFEQYYKILTYFEYKLGCNFKAIEAKTSIIDGYSTELYYKNKMFCIHTWYTRIYKTDKKTFNRINNVLSIYKNNYLASADMNNIKKIISITNQDNLSSDKLLEDFSKLNISKSEYENVLYITKNKLEKLEKPESNLNLILYNIVKNGTLTYAQYVGWHSYFTAIEPVYSITNNEQHAVSFIIVNRDGTQLDKVIKNIKSTFLMDLCEIIIINQEDNDLFKRGQLYNAAVTKANGKYLCLMDNDIINLRYVNLIDTYYKYGRKPFVLFKNITQLTYKDNDDYYSTSTSPCPEGFGGTLFISKDDFIKKNGYSNLCFGWGCEDNISNIKFDGIIRLNQDLGHITHPRRVNKNPGSTKLNQQYFEKYNNGNIDGMKDGYDQTCFETTYDYVDKDGIRRIGVKNFSVPANFEYMDLYDKQVEESKKRPMSTCVIIPLLNENPSESEAMSFEQCLTVLSNRKIFTISKHGFDVQKYKDIESKARGAKFFHYFLPDNYFNDEYGMQELFKTAGFYDMFKDYEYILKYDLTSYVFTDRIDEFTNSKIDYIAAPVFKIDNNGENMAHYADEDTFALMKISKMRELSLNATEDDYKIKNGEWFCEKHDATSSNLKGAMSFSFYNEPYTCFVTNDKKLPMGCAKFEENYDNFWKLIIKIDK